MKWQPAKIKGHNGYDPKEASQACVVELDGVSLTIQSQAEDADINVLMKRFGITGQMPANPRLPMYGDFTEVKDFRSAFDAVRQAQENFMTIPAEIRGRFMNDPQNFLEFCANPENTPEMVKLGLAKLTPEGELKFNPKKPEVAPPAPPPAPPTK